MSGEFLCFTVVGVELVALGMHFDNFGSLHAPFPSLMFSLGIDVELGQEVLDITLVLDVHKTSLEFLSEGQLLVAVSLTWWLSAPSTV